MNYKRIYEDLIASAKTKNTCPTTYYEKHHILPKSMGGSDDQSNLVKLTPRQHFIAHRLLTKFTTGKDRFRMIKAVTMMQLGSSTKHKTTARTYQRLKVESLQAKRLNLRSLKGADKDIFPLSKYFDAKSGGGMFNYSSHLIHKLNLKRVDTVKGELFITACFLKSIYLLGFKGISISKESGNLPPRLNRFKSEGILIQNKESKGFIIDIDKLNSIFTIHDCSLYGIKTITSKILCHYRSGCFTPIFRKYNQQNIKNLVTTLERPNKRSPLVLASFNNWLDSDHPLADKFYRPISVEEAKRTLQRLAIMNTGFTRKASQYIPEDLPEDFEITSIQKAA